MSSSKGGLAYTGSPAASVGIGGMAVLALGLLLTYAGRRRKGGVH